MSIRLLSRSIVLQTLFEWDFDVETGAADVVHPEAILQRNIAEFDPGSKDQAFMRRLLGGVLEKHHAIDEAIARVEPQWPIDKIARVDRNILRIGILELLFESFTVVPERIAIEQAGQLAKNFSSESGVRFVNRVLVLVYLDSVYHRLQTENFI